MDLDHTEEELRNSIYINAPNDDIKKTTSKTLKNKKEDILKHQEINILIRKGRFNISMCHFLVIQINTLSLRRILSCTGMPPALFSLDDSHLLDRRYNNPMYFLQRYTFVMYFIQRLKPQWGEWGIKGCSETYNVTISSVFYATFLPNRDKGGGKGDAWH